VRLGHRVRMVTQRLPDTAGREYRRGIEIHRFPAVDGHPFTAVAADDGLYADADVVCMFGVGHDPRARWWLPVLDASLASHGVRLLKVGTDGDISQRGIPAELYRRLEGVLCQTTAIAREAQAVGVPADACYPVRNGLPLRQWTAGQPTRSDARRELSIADTAYVVLGLGRFTHRKRFPELVAAFATFASEADVPAGRAGPVLLLHGSDFGQDDGEEPALRARVAALGPSFDVRFVPPTIASAVSLAATDVMVTLSEREGAPNVLVEALASSRPVVASDLPGHRVYIQDGRQGLVVPLGDTAAAAAALARLHDCPQQRSRMGEHAHTTAIHFDIARTCRDYLRAFAHARSRTWKESR
jgi:glycosyltransferase involved in cell wall biosynthesis